MPSCETAATEHDNSEGCERNLEPVRRENTHAHWAVVKREHNVFFDSGQQAVPEQIHNADYLTPQNDGHIEQKLRDNQEPDVLRITNCTRVKVWVHCKIASNASQKTCGCNRGESVNSTGEAGTQKRDAP
jgi:hypothetical protein